MPGAYGLKLVGAEGAGPLLLADDPAWPTLEIERRLGPTTTRPSAIGADAAEIALLGASRLAMQRTPLRATFTTGRLLSDEALVHPYLAPAAAVAGYWLGRDSFHAGAFAVDDGVWAMLGHKESGKSSLLATLSRSGVDVVADDAVIVDRGVVFAGPRSIDLRSEAATELKVGEALGVVGDRERWRLRLPRVPGAGRLCGWVFLSWGDSFSLTRASAGGRLQRLLAHRIINALPPPDPELLLELASLPALHLGRPRHWAQLETVAGQLVEAVSSHRVRS